MNESVKESTKEGTANECTWSLEGGRQNHHVHLPVFVCLKYEYMIVYVLFVYTEERLQVE